MGKNILILMILVFYANANLHSEEINNNQIIDLILNKYNIIYSNYIDLNFQNFEDDLYEKFINSKEGKGKDLLKRILLRNKSLKIKPLLEDELISKNSISQDLFEYLQTVKFENILHPIEERFQSDNKNIQSKAQYLVILCFQGKSYDAIYLNNIKNNFIEKINLIYDTLIQKKISFANDGLKKNQELIDKAVLANDIIKQKELLESKKILEEYAKVFANDWANPRRASRIKDLLQEFEYIAYLSDRENYWDKINNIPLENYMSSIKYLKVLRLYPDKKAIPFFTKSFEKFLAEYGTNNSVKMNDNHLIEASWSLIGQKLHIYDKENLEAFQKYFEIFKNGKVDSVCLENWKYMENKYYISQIESKLQKSKDI